MGGLTARLAAAPDVRIAAVASAGALHGGAGNDVALGTDPRDVHYGEEGNDNPSGVG
jgi:hypothetical protein